MVNVPAELADRFLPRESSGWFIQYLTSVLRERPVKLSHSHPPHLFHRPLPFRTEIEVGNPFVERGKEPAHYVIGLFPREHIRTSLYKQILVEEKHFRTDARFIRSRIIRQDKFTKSLRRRSGKRHAEQRHDTPPNLEIFGFGPLCHTVSYSTTTAVPLALTINMLLFVPIVS